MNYEERRKVFIDHIVQPKSQIALLQLEALFQLNKSQFVSAFLASFEHLCKQILAKQAQGEKDAIGYIMYSLLRTEIAEGRSFYLLEATDRYWYLDRQPVTAMYDASWAFEPLHQLERELEPEARKNVGMNARPEIEKVKRDYASKFHGYVVKFIRYAMVEAAQLKAFQELEKETVLEVRVGEYLDLSEVVYKEDRRVKQAEEVKASFAKKHGTEYTYGVYSHLDLSGGDYESINVNYADFRHSNLSFSRLNGSSLIGATFTHCQLKAAQFCKCLLCEADFRESDLQDALFCSSIALNGMRDPSLWEHPGFLPINFSRANLRGADFAYSDMRGAIFVGADVRDVQFKGANLEGALFSTSARELLSLDDDQRAGVIWVHEGAKTYEPI